MNIENQQDSEKYIEFSTTPDSPKANLMSQIDQIEENEELYLSNLDSEDLATNVSLARHVSVLLTGQDPGRELVKQRTKADRKKSCAYVTAYIKKERTVFMIGMMYMFLGLLIDLCVPIYIGVMTDDVSNNNASNLYFYTALILLVICVSSS